MKKQLLISVLLVIVLCLGIVFSSSVLADTDNTEVSHEILEPNLNDVKAARYDTQYAMYYAHKALRKLNLLDEIYIDLDLIYDKAAKAWYKGQYYMDLVTCGEIKEDNEIKEYLSKAFNYFNQAKTHASYVAEALKY